MDKGIAFGGRFWWVWPSFSSERDARNGSIMGVMAVGLIVLVTVAVASYQYSADGDVYRFGGGLLESLVWCVLGYGIHRMSRVAAVIGLILFVADKGYALLQGQSLGIATILGLYLINGTRAVFWFRGQGKKEASVPSPD